MTKHASHKVRSGLEVIQIVLEQAAPRPDRSDDQRLKNEYAIRFADLMATAIADDLRGRLIGIEASTKRRARASRGPKQLDVNFSTPELGLALGISLKSVHTRDKGSSARYTHNMKRNEEELRVEAMGYHKRQPYAVMVAILILPFDSCDDGTSGPSSFGSWVRHLRPYAGRRTPAEDGDRFERIFIGLYEPDGSELQFFDVEIDPPKRGRPAVFEPGALNSGRCLSYPELLDAICREHAGRTRSSFRWAEGEEDPLTPDEFGD